MWFERPRDTWLMACWCSATTHKLTLKGESKSLWNRIRIDNNSLNESRVLRIIIFDQSTPRPNLPMMPDICVEHTTSTQFASSSDYTFGISEGFDGFEISSTTNENVNWSSSCCQCDACCAMVSWIRLYLWLNAHTHTRKRRTLALSNAWHRRSGVPNEMQCLIIK